MDVLIPRDINCTQCRLSQDLSPNEICVVGVRSKKSRILVVSRLPLSGNQRAELDEYLREVGIKPEQVVTTAVTKCRVWNMSPTKADIKACAPYLEAEVDALKPQIIVAMGNEALNVLTGHSGIMLYRSREYNYRGCVVIPTISPQVVKRNPGQRESFVGDLRYVSRLLHHESPPTAPPPRIRYVTTGAGVQALREAILACSGVSYDLETTGFDEFKPDSRIVTASFTVWDKDDTAPREVWVLPLYHPESPFKNRWRKVLRQLKGCFENKRVVAHNGKFDGRWMSQFNVPVNLTFDTMLAAYLLNENRPKGLKPLAQSLLGVPAWGIDTKNLLDEPLRKIVQYNALDTWYTAHLYFLLRKQILKQPRLVRILARLLVPASNILTEVERVGIWTDREKLQTNAEISLQTLAAIDNQLMLEVPAEEHWPENIKGVNFNASNFARWWLFDFFGFPVLARGKTKEDGSPGMPSMAEAVMLKLAADFPDHPVPKLMIERTKWQKYSSSFFNAYLEQIDDNDRIHTSFKLTGTVTGRLSSGKNDQEKVTSKVQNRGVNLQQVPRDKFVRGLFGAPPGWVFVECDYSQVELRLAAFIAQEKTMLQLYGLGKDIHQTMAQRMTGRLDITADERKKAKAVNFGFLYGMGWAKFIETAWSNYGVVVTEGEAQAFRIAFFEQFPGLIDWHNRQRRLARLYKRVESPLGRVRHLPDIDSADNDVRAEAQRQAINSPVQSFASDMTVLSLISLTDTFRATKLKARSVGTVHDAINFEMPVNEVPFAVPLIREVMENLPLEEDFNVRLNVPIIADVKIGTRWGGALEIPSAISCNSELMNEWMKENSGTLFGE